MKKRKKSLFDRSFDYANSRGMLSEIAHIEARCGYYNGYRAAQRAERRRK